MTRTWPSRSSAPRTGGTDSATSVRSSTPWRSANSRRRSTEATGQSAEVDVVEQDQRPAALDPRQVEQLVDHLDEVVRLDLDLADPVAHPGRDRLARRVGLADEGLGQQADRGQRGPQLVRQVVDELGPDPLQAAQLGDVLHDQPDAPDRRSAGPDDQGRSVIPAEGQLAARGAGLAGRLGHAFDRRVDERLDGAPTDERAGGPPEELVGGRVGDVDQELVVEPDDAHPDDVEQGRAVAHDLAGLPLGRPDPIEQRADGLLDVDVVRVYRCDRVGVGTAVAGEQLADPSERPAADDRQPDRGAQHDGLDDDEADDHRIHGRSIAHARSRGLAITDGLQ